MGLKPSSTHRLRKMARKGGRGFPVATVAFYGPDDRSASKVTVGLIVEEGGDAIALERFFSDDDARFNEDVAEQILTFIKGHNVRSVVLADRIIGCPHEEGVDYPAGESCPSCPFWEGRNRFTGEVEH